MKIECTHDWYVVEGVIACPWESHMRYRGEENPPDAITYAVSHTLICNFCRLIKQIENNAK